MLFIFLPPYIRDSYEAKKLLWLFDNGFYPGPNVPTESELAALPSKLLPAVILELVIFTAIPAALGIFVSHVITKRMPRR